MVLYSELRSGVNCCRSSDHQSVIINNFLLRKTGAKTFAALMAKYLLVKSTVNRNYRRCILLNSNSGLVNGAFSVNLPRLAPSNPPAMHTQREYFSVSYCGMGDRGGKGREGKERTRGILVTGTTKTT
jgi:hypothetical protein